MTSIYCSLPARWLFKHCRCQFVTALESKISPILHSTLLLRQSISRYLVSRVTRDLGGQLTDHVTLSLSWRSARQRVPLIDILDNERWSQRMTLWWCGDQFDIGSVTERGLVTRSLTTVSEWASSFLTAHRQVIGHGPDFRKNLMTNLWS